MADSGTASVTDRAQQEIRATDHPGPTFKGQAALNWNDFWDALEQNHAFPSAGLTLLVLGAAFHWFEPLTRLLGRVDARDWIAERRAAGDEAAARRAEERIRDQQARMTRYAHVMMVAGAIIVALSVLLRSLGGN